MSSLSNVLHKLSSKIVIIFYVRKTGVVGQSRIVCFYRTGSKARFLLCPVSFHLTVHSITATTTTTTTTTSVFRRARIATRYGLDGPGIEFPWKRDFSLPSRQALGPTQPPIRGPTEK